MPYSAVSQPCPLPRRKGGTPGVTETVHSTWVRPKAASTDPAAWQVKPRVKVTGRRASDARPLGRSCIALPFLMTVSLADHDSTARPAPGPATLEALARRAP